MSILDYFPKPYKPRPIQTKALLEIEKSWDKADVFVIGLPVASGKSFFAKTIQNWQNNGAIIVPNNLLVDQYRKDFPNLAGIIGKQNYQCTDSKFEGSCKKRGDRFATGKAPNKKPKQCPGCPWSLDNKRIRSPYTTRYVTNNHLFVQLRKHQPVLIADEAHNLVEFLQQWHAVRISSSRYKYPRHGGYLDRAELLKWLESLKGIDRIIKNPGMGEKGLQILYHELTSDYPRFLLKESAENKMDYQGNQYQEVYLNLCPVDVRDMPAILWPPTTRKIILLSATINRKDIEELGLQDKRVKYIEADSCIPANRRPVTYIKTSPVSGTNLANSTPLVADRVLNLADSHQDSKGVVHATYNQASLLKRQFGDNSRFLYHNRTNKKQVYQRFRETEEPVILVASGLYEGIDLPEDAGRWQVITKVPFPNLGEPAIKYRMAKDSDWFSWQATKVILQASGRICRGPEDFGETFIVDDNFKRLYTENPDMYPEWYKQSVKGV